MNMSGCLTKPAVSALIIMDDRVLLVKRGSAPSGGLWSLPGGRIEPGETMKEALAREVMEETSLQIEVDDLAGAYDVISREGDEIAYHYVIITFRARVVDGELMAGSDASDARWISESELNSCQMTPGLLDTLRSLWQHV